MPRIGVSEKKKDNQAMCVRVSLQTGGHFKVAEPEKRVTQTKTQETFYCETTNHTFRGWNETC